MIVYVDESGFQKNWVFVAVKIPSERSARLCVKNWRRYAVAVSSKFNVNEYKDSKAPDRQREKILSEISFSGYQFWVLYFGNYKGHKKDYCKAVFELLREVDLHDVSIIMLDKVERSQRYMQKHIERITASLSCVCPIRLGISEKGKGIQIADAICGSVSRKLNNIEAQNYFYLVEHLMKKIIRIGK